MSKTTNLFATIAIAAITVSALAGCVSTPEVDAPRAISTSTPEPTETVEPVVIDPLDLDGNGSVSEHEKRVAAMVAVRDYTLDDGTVVSVDPAEPLTEAVRADVARIATTGVAAYYDKGSSADLYAALVAESELTGRVIIAVFEGSPGHWVAVSSAKYGGLFIAVSTQAEAVEKATAFGQHQRNFDIIIL